MANAYKNRIPPITTVKRTINGLYVLMEHKKPACHKAVLLAHQKYYGMKIALTTH